MTSKLLLIPVGLVIVIMLYLAVLSFKTRHTIIKAESERQLSPCPQTPNCVSSLSSDEPHRVDEFPLLNADPTHSWQKLISAVQHSGGNILVDDGGYCHAVYTSSLFRFKDDVELSKQVNGIAIRSASRAGRSDLGQNRKRVEFIRELYLGI